MGNLIPYRKKRRDVFPEKKADREILGCFLRNANRRKEKTARMLASRIKDMPALHRTQSDGEIRIDSRPCRSSRIRHKAAWNVGRNDERIRVIDDIDERCLLALHFACKARSNQRIDDDIRIIEVGNRFFCFHHLNDRNPHLLSRLPVHLCRLSHVGRIPHEDDQDPGACASCIAGADKSIPAIIARAADNDSECAFPVRKLSHAADDSASCIFHQDSFRQSVLCHSDLVQQPGLRRTCQNHDLPPAITTTAMDI